jgi:hypothetical protein
VHALLITIRVYIWGTWLNDHSYSALEFHSHQRVVASLSEAALASALGAFRHGASIDLVQCGRFCLH